MKKNMRKTSDAELTKKMGFAWFDQPKKHTHTHCEGADDQD